MMLQSITSRRLTGKYFRCLLLVCSLLLFQQCMERAPEQTAQLRNSADSMFTAKNYTGARDLYEQALTLQPDDYYLLAQLQKCRQMISHPDHRMAEHQATTSGSMPANTNLPETPVETPGTTPAETAPANAAGKPAKRKTVPVPAAKSPAVPAEESAAEVMQTNPEIASPPGKYPEMILVQGGTFKMGSNEGDVDEKPVHSVTLSSFYMAKHEVTVAQYRDFCMSSNRKMPNAPGWGWHDDHPMVNLTWKDATAYCAWLSEQTKQRYRLPTEAEWEFAARGGTKTKGYKYAGSNDLSEVAWHGDNSEGKTHPVGTKKPNELGLYDMSGNAFEWCSDIYHDKYYANSPAKNPTGAQGGDERILRGGSWYGNGKYGCRVAIRISCIPDARDDYDGLRVVRSQ